MLDSIDTVFAALANWTRRELLRLLRDTGLVSEQKQGQYRYYRLQGATFHFTLPQESRRSIKNKTESTRL
jgi:DNA-binding transcriptional ArsR family regulator